MLDDREQVVNTQETTTTPETEVVNNAQETTPEQTQEQQGQDQSSETQEVNESVVKDDRDIKNVAWEAKRKADELYQTLNPLVNEFRELKTQLSQFQQQPQQPKYTKAQLQTWLETNPDVAPEHRVWAKEEIEKIDREERRKEMQEIFEGYQKKTSENLQRQKTFEEVSGLFPQMFLRDASGNVQFNPSDQLFQAVNSYMQMDSSLQSHPHGLLAAAKMAAFDLGIKPQNPLMNKLQKTQAQLRKVQKQTLVNSGGSTPPARKAPDTIAKLTEEYRNTGSKEVFKEILRAKGILPKE